MVAGHILVADDHPVVREGLSVAARMALPGSPIVPAGSVAEAVDATESRPHWRMILIDLMLRDARGFSGLVALQYRNPGTPIVIVTAQEDADRVEAARALGAAGYLPKTMPLDTIAGRLRRIDRGERVFPATGAAVPQIEAARQRIAPLSTTQLGVLMALADGRSTPQIADTFDLPEQQVEAHQSAIYRTMGVAGRDQALLAIRPLTGDLPAAAPSA